MRLASVVVLAFLTGCAGIPIHSTKPIDCSYEEGFGKDVVTGVAKMLPFECIDEPTEVVLPTYEQLRQLPPPYGERPVVAVYKFDDLTGQRKARDNIADFSTAVTQGGSAMLIDALTAAGSGSWFRVVERVGLDHLVRERQIVRSTREEYSSNGDDSKLNPLLFAGMLIEGGIIGYDTNIESGGRGARYLGVGSSVQYKRDVVVVSLRAVSTLTGEILLNVQAQKTILSVGGGFDVFRFVDMDTKLVEYEDGDAWNESVTYATRQAVEAAVLQLIKQGDDAGFWIIDEPNIGENE